MRSLSLRKTNISTGIHRMFKGFKNISHMFGKSFPPINHANIRIWWFWPSIFLTYLNVQWITSCIQGGYGRGGDCHRDRTPDRRETCYTYWMGWLLGKLRSPGEGLQVGQPFHRSSAAVQQWSNSSAFISWSYHFWPQEPSESARQKTESANSKSGAPLRASSSQRLKSFPADCFLRRWLEDGMRKASFDRSCTRIISVPLRLVLWWSFHGFSLLLSSMFTFYSSSLHKLIVIVCKGTVLICCRKVSI